VVVIARASYRITFPSRVQFVATMNPCPCGRLGERRGNLCQCSPEQVRRYRGRISGPLLDRIDLHVEVPSVSLRELEETPPGESSATVRVRVLEARRTQEQRYQGTGIRSNADLTPASIRRFCPIDGAGLAIMAKACERLGLTARGYDRVRKVSRTIADLAGREKILASDVAEAISYRVLDRNYSTD